MDLVLGVVPEWLISSVICRYLQAYCSPPVHFIVLASVEVRTLSSAFHFIVIVECVGLN